MGEQLPPQLVSAVEAMGTMRDICVALNQALLHATNGLADVARLAARRDDMEVAELAIKVGQEVNALVQEAIG